MLVVVLSVSSFSCGSHSIRLLGFSINRNVFVPEFEPNARRVFNIGRQIRYSLSDRGDISCMRWLYSNSQNHLLKASSNSVSLTMVTHVNMNDDKYFILVHMSCTIGPVAPQKMLPFVRVLGTPTSTVVDPTHNSNPSNFNITHMEVAR